MTKKMVFLIGAVIVMLVVLSYVLPKSYIHPPTPTLPLQPPLTWNNITVGQTSLLRAQEILGEPDEIERRINYTAYIYKERSELGWGIIETWISKTNNIETVNGIVVAFPRKTEPTVCLPVPRYRPNKVTWSAYSYVRYLIWSSNGIALTSSTAIQNWNKLCKPSVALIFNPMTTEDFMSLEFAGHTYWTGPAPRNIYTGPGGVIDSDPEDPFDWNSFDFTGP